MVRWTLGVYSRDIETCPEERFDGSKITEPEGKRLAAINPGSFGFSLVQSLNSPSVESMNCEEFCNCLSWSHGYHSYHEDQHKGPGGESRLMCRFLKLPTNS